MTDQEVINLLLGRRIIRVEADDHDFGLTLILDNGVRVDFSGTSNLAEFGSPLLLVEADDNAQKESKR